MAKKEIMYQIELTERQTKLLSYVCDQFTRLIQGQDQAYQELFEAAWEKRAKKVTGNSMDKEFEGGWYKCREDAEDFCRQIKKRFWNLDNYSLHGIGYDDTADILWDIHCVIRHQLFLDSKRDYFGVDSSPATRVGDEPLITIKKITTTSGNAHLL